MFLAPIRKSRAKYSKVKVSPTEESVAVFIHSSDRATLLRRQTLRWLSFKRVAITIEHVDSSYWMAFTMQQVSTECCPQRMVSILRAYHRCSSSRFRYGKSESVESVGDATRVSVRSSRTSRNSRELHSRPESWRLLALPGSISLEFSLQYFSNPI